MDIFPIGHEVWEGKKSDKLAFKEVIEKIKYLEENGYEYILGVKMRQMSYGRGGRRKEGKR